MKDMEKYNAFNEFDSFFVEDEQQRQQLDVNRFRTLIQTIITTANTYPADPIAQYHAACAIRQCDERGNIHELAYLNKILILDPKFTLAYVRLLEIYFDQENYIAALENLIEAKNNLIEPPKECLSSLEEIETTIKEYQEKLLSNTTLLQKIKQLKTRHEFEEMDDLSKEIHRASIQNEINMKLIQSDRLEELEKLNEQLQKMLMEDSFPDMLLRTFFHAKNQKPTLIRNIQKGLDSKIKDLSPLVESFFSNELLIIMLGEFLDQNQLQGDSKIDNLMSPSKTISDKNPSSSVLRPLTEAYSRVLMLSPKDVVEESKIGADTIVIQAIDGFLQTYWHNNGMVQTNMLVDNEIKTFVKPLPAPEEESRDQTLIKEIMTKFKIPIPTLFASTESLLQISLIMQLMILTIPKWGLDEILVLIKKSEQEAVSLKQVMLQMYKDIPRPIDHTILYFETSVRKELVDWIQGEISLIADEKHSLSEFLKKPRYTTHSHQSSQSPSTFFKTQLANSDDKVITRLSGNDYTRFKKNRRKTHKFLIKNISEVSEILIPLVENALLTQGFINYLRSMKIEDLTLFYNNYSKEKNKQTENTLKSYAKDIKFVEAYLDFELKDCKADSKSYPLILELVLELVEKRYIQLENQFYKIAEYHKQQSTFQHDDSIKHLFLNSK